MGYELSDDLVPQASVRHLRQLETSLPDLSVLLSPKIPGPTSTLLGQHLLYSQVCAGSCPLLSGE